MDLSRIAPGVSVCIVALAGAGCTYRVSDFRLESVDLVAERPTRGCALGLGDQFDCDSQNRTPILRVLVSTEVDLVETASRLELNTWASAGPCPLRVSDGSPFYARGPYRQGVLVGLMDEQRMADIYAATGGPPDGRHVYEVYVAVAGRGQRGSINSPPYNLIETPQDLCLIVGGGNMAGMRVLSSTLEIDEAVVRTALAATPADALD